MSNPQPDKTGPRRGHSDRKPHEGNIIKTRGLKNQTDTQSELRILQTNITNIKGQTGRDQENDRTNKTESAEKVTKKNE